MLDRMKRVCEAVKREIAVILQNEVHDIRIQQVTITRVDVTRDLRLAKVYYSTTAAEKYKDSIQDGLDKTSSFVRRELAERLSMKYTPEISFRVDKNETASTSVKKLFEQIEKENEEKLPEDVIPPDTDINQDD